MDIKLENELGKAACLGMQNAFTPNNKPEDARFGAAVLTREGNIYSAGQYFSDTYSLTIHAEQAAFIHAAAHGEYIIEAIAIVSNTKHDATYPCHMCKQILYENYLRSKCNMKILLFNGNGKIIERLLLLDMITHAWP